MAAIWCPDWPVTAAATEAGVPQLSRSHPVAVMIGNRVMACSHSARQAGVRRGLARREAQSRCPDLVILPRTELAEIRAFEPVVRAVESIAPGVELTRPGLATIGLAGPTRYFGSEAAVLHALTRSIEQAISGLDVIIGAADGAFAAEQAARRGALIEPGESAAFLADLPIASLDPRGDSPLADLLARLGIHTLGAFATLPGHDVLARFGPAGGWAHRQAGGQDDRPVAGRRPARDMGVSVEFSPPVDRVDTVAFSVREVSQQFVAELAAHGLACACLEITAVTDNDEQTTRRWRHTAVMGSLEVLDRLRWQLEGWLAGQHRPTSGIVKVTLTPVETVPTGTHQQALWGGAGADDERAQRGLSRVQTLLGHGSVLVPVLGGGRDPNTRTELVPWGDNPVPTRSPTAPWPGSLPPPHPTVLLHPPSPVEVLDAAGKPVTVTDRGAVGSQPATLRTGSSTVVVTAWAGPWPVDERWWEPASASSTTGLRARFQLVDAHGRAYLASHHRDDNGVHWTLDALYD